MLPEAAILSRVCGGTRFSTQKNARPKPDAFLQFGIAA